MPKKASYHAKRSTDSSNPTQLDTPPQLDTTSQLSTLTQLSMPPKFDDVDIIGYERVSAGSEMDIPTVARDTLYNALENATYGQTGDRLVYGNRLGLEFIEERGKQNARFDSLEATLSILRADITALKIQHENELQYHKDELQYHKHEIQCLKLASDGYIKIRQRFLDVFRRDVLKDKSGQSTSSINAGNIAAHGGDAVTDARIFESGIHKDNGPMTIIYGLDPIQVLLLDQEDDDGSLSIINARATLAPKKDKPIHPDIEDAWNTYIILLKNNWGQKPKDNPTSALGKGYFQFWDVYKKFVN